MWKGCFGDYKGNYVNLVSEHSTDVNLWREFCKGTLDSSLTHVVKDKYSLALIN